MSWNACLRLVGRDDERLMSCLDRISECAETLVPPHNLPRIDALPGNSERNRAIFAFYKLSKLVELADRRALGDLAPFTTWDRQEGVPESWRTFISVYVDDLLELHNQLIQSEKHSRSPLNLSSTVTRRLLGQARVPFNQLWHLETEMTELERQIEAARFHSEVKRIKDLKQKIELNRRVQAAQTVKLFSIFFTTTLPIALENEGLEEADEESSDIFREALEKLQVFVCHELEAEPERLPNVGNLKVRRSFIMKMMYTCCVEHCLGRRSGVGGVDQDGQP
jgi:hypothetical protein